MSGKLFIVATPIGNLEDLSERGRRALAEADLVACEDTRRTGRLLQRLGLDKPTVSLHEHNERARLPRLLDRLAAGARVAVVSDAGTPLISDPGFLLTRGAVARAIPVEAIPGPSAILAALAVSALPPYPFTFCGFPPRRPGRRRRFLRGFAALDHTLVLFESPHRIAACLEDALAELGDRPAAVCRELTKLHEEVLRGSLSELVEQVRERGALKGEITLVVARPEERPDAGESAGG